MSHSFGGDWTEEKLNRVSKYLRAYTTIMKKYNFQYAYIDAFAGTGYRTLKDDDSNTLMLPELLEEEPQKFIDGSARIALQVQPRFDKYIFIEKDINKITELAKLKQEFSNLSDSIVIENTEANSYIKNLCKKNWVNHRAVLFLDPYGMQIPWTTIELIAKTEAIDLWYLFPVGIAINRLLKKDGIIKKSHKNRLDEIFGTNNWYDFLYNIEPVVDLFGYSYHNIKKNEIDTISSYFIGRLKTVFPGVAENPLLLYNSRNVPLYLLCFASANRKGAPTAIKIAQDILKK